MQFTEIKETQKKWSKLEFLFEHVKFEISMNQSGAIKQWVNKFILQEMSPDLDLSV